MEQPLEKDDGIILEISEVYKNIGKRTTQVLYSKLIKTFPMGV